MTCRFEEWRVVPSDTRLEASSIGRIRIRPWTNSNGKVYKGAPTYGAWDGRRFIFTRRGYGTRRVARLVCEAFHGLPNEERQVCMHDDENARNNAATNLMWGTQKENLNYPKFLEYCRSGEPGYRVMPV